MTKRTELYADPHNLFLHDLVLASCRRNPNKTALADASCNRRITYTDAVSFAVMESARCSSALSFDHDFVVASTGGHEQCDLALGIDHHDAAEPGVGQLLPVAEKSRIDGFLVELAHRPRDPFPIFCVQMSWPVVSPWG